MTVVLECSENETQNSHGLSIKLVELVQLSIKLVQQQPTICGSYGVFATSFSGQGAEN